jgi:limonene-1,2-epoxide hydrolase
MGEQENRALVERVWNSTTSDFTTVLDEVLADDCVEEWPQSGERIRGKANILAINRNYPGLPTSTVRKITASGPIVVSEVDLDYGGKPYHAVSIFEIADGKIVHETDYFAEPFEAPQWRAQWVERM